MMVIIIIMVIMIFPRIKTRIKSMINMVIKITKMKIRMNKSSYFRVKLKRTKFEL